MEKVLTLKIEKFSNSGEGIARHEGFVIFVENALPNDVVRVEVIKENKHFAKAKILEIIEPSEGRIKPFCALYNACGACSLQNAAYDFQLKLKKEIVQDAIKILSILVIVLGALCVLVWGLNTVSQNKTLTSKFIHYQIERLLDLDSEVENPHAYLDWDLQYKIRADRLSFIQDGSELVKVEDVNVNVFLPYMLFKKIYITNMSGSNLFVDFERYKDGKINIIEIFNIKSFFDVYFRNSSISIDRYFFRFTDKFHTPEEKFFVSGDNIFLNKCKL